jgi:phage shock protein E
MGFFSFLDSGASTIKEALLQDAVIVDVRPPYQYDQGKIPGSLNIPIEQVPKNAGYLKRLRKPIVFCGNGSEASSARRILQQYGVKEAYNGGSWQRVLRLKNSI